MVFAAISNSIWISSCHRKICIICRFASHNLVYTHSALRPMKVESVVRFAFEQKDDTAVIYLIRLSSHASDFFHRFLDSCFLCNCVEHAPADLLSPPANCFLRQIGFAVCRHSAAVDLFLNLTLIYVCMSLCMRANRPFPSFLSFFLHAAFFLRMAIIVFPPNKVAPPPTHDIKYYSTSHG